jgi:hypothetical protein
MSLYLILWSGLMVVITNAAYYILPKSHVEKNWGFIPITTASFERSIIDFDAGLSSDP